jgi:hypothetical protein
MRSVKFAGNLTLLAFAFASCASADVVYTNVSSFMAASIDPIEVGFNGILPPGVLSNPPYSFSPTNSVSLGDVPLPCCTTLYTEVQFFANNGYTNLDAANYYSGSPYPAAFITNNAVSADNEVTAGSFYSPYYAVGLFYGGGAGGGPATFTDLSDGFVYSVPSLPSLGSTDFIGFISTTPISELSFDAGGDSWVVLGAALGSDSPEPASYAIPLGVGFAGVFILKRRRRAA